MVGPGLAFLNMFGEAIELEFFYRISTYPEFYQAEEYLTYLSSDWIGSFPLEYEIFLVHYDLYNPLLLYNENSLSFNIDTAYRINKLMILFNGSYFRVNHDTENEIFYTDEEEREIFLTEQKKEFVPQLGTGIALDLRDREINTENGLYSELRYSYYGGILGGPAKYKEFLLDLRLFKTFLSKSIIHFSLLAQYRPGKMSAYSYYHVGGPNSLRGYKQSPENFAIHELLTTTEYRYKLIKTFTFNIGDYNLYSGLQLIAGIDTATLWKHFNSTNKNETLSSFYSGIHILFPGFQRLRLEFGGHRNNNKFKFAFTSGFYEKSEVQRWIVR